MIDPNRLYYSAHEEEKVINNYLNKNPDTELGTYIDIGAGDPIEGNNTYYYYLRNWKGLLVEPYPRCAITIPKERPEDIFEPIAISDYEGTISMCDSAAVKTNLGAEYKERWPEKVRNVPCITLTLLINKYPQFQTPDILSIDVETHEKEVLTGANFEIFKPHIILVEYRVRGYDYRHKWEAMLNPYYEFKEIVGANALYVRKTI